MNGSGRWHISLNRSRFLKVISAGIASTSILRGHGDTAGTGKPDVVVGVLTDCQYADIDTPPKSKRLYRQSPAKLKAAIEHFNAMGDIDFMMHLGDAVDCKEQSYNVVTPLFATAACPIHHVAGNHDFDIADTLKSRVHSLLGMPAPYYSIERNKWRFVMLDGNELSLFAFPKNSPRWQEAQEFRSASARKLADYNGGLGGTQRAWLVKELAAARAACQRVILCCHYPLFPTDGHVLWDAEAVTEIVRQNGDIIAAWWNGHNHDGNYAARHGIHFLNYRGMVDTPKNSYARVALYQDRIEVTGYGRETHRVLRFPAQDFPRPKPAHSKSPA